MKSYAAKIKAIEVIKNTINSLKLQLLKISGLHIQYKETLQEIENLQKFIDRSSCYSSQDAREAEQERDAANLKAKEILAKITASKEIALKQELQKSEYDLTVLLRQLDNIKAPISVLDNDAAADNYADTLRINAELESNGYTKPSGFQDELNSFCASRNSIKNAGHGGTQH